ncbi:haloacid dehalogenase type II [Streptomyces sp. cmx-4-9]|uniref:haloacid dehalogenase type II n=1 Tax=Streptomyces sp. cmx-4-9 TaxID=2790941 RepID=UPI00398062A6
MPRPEPRLGPRLEIDTLVFDVLGTLVDDQAGVRAGLRQLAPGLAGAETGELQSLWERHVEDEQRRIRDGARPYAAGDALDAEAARLVVDAVGAAASGAGERLARAARRRPPWPDTVAGLARLAERFRLIGLSNASRPELLELGAGAGLRWHLLLSAEEVATYKPDPAVYQLAVRASGRPPDRLLMVAAHAWDLRGAQGQGLRTAYVARPTGEPPSPADRFDLYADGLFDLADRLDLASG